MSGAFWPPRRSRFADPGADTFKRGAKERRLGSNVLNSRIVFSASLALALLAVQFAAIRLAPSDAPLRIVLPLTIALVPVALWPHRAHLGVWIIFIGLAANLAAVVANGGLMPIEQDTVIEAVGAEQAAGYAPGAWIEGSKDVLLAPGQGRLVPLGDSILIRVGGRGIAASPGDMVVWTGLLALVAEASLAWQKRQSNSDKSRETRRDRSSDLSGEARLGERNSADAGTSKADGSATTPT